MSQRHKLLFPPVRANSRQYIHRQIYSRGEGGRREGEEKEHIQRGWCKMSGLYGEESLPGRTAQPLGWEVHGWGKGMSGRD